MKTIALMLLAACSPAPDATCPKATAQQCATMQVACESYCEHKCLSQQPCVSTCWADECTPFEQACPDMCTECVPGFTAMGAETVCTPPVAP